MTGKAMAAAIMITAINVLFMVCLSLSKFQLAELCRAGLVLKDRVVGVLSAIPILDANRIAQFPVGLVDVPGFCQSRRVIDPHIDTHGLVVGLLPDLDGFNLIRIVGISTLIDAGLQLVGMHHQLAAVPESER